MIPGGIFFTSGLIAGGDQKGEGKKRKKNGAVKLLCLPDRFSLKFLNFSPYDDWHENCNLKGVSLNPSFLFAPIRAAFIPTLAGSTGRMDKMGKAGKNAFGFYGAHDRINNLLFPSDQGYLPASPTKQP